MNQCSHPQRSTGVPPGVALFDIANICGVFAGLDSPLLTRREVLTSGVVILATILTGIREASEFDLVPTNTETNGWIGPIFADFTYFAGDDGFTAFVDAKEAVFVVLLGIGVHVVDVDAAVLITIEAVATSGVGDAVGELVGDFAVMLAVSDDFHGRLLLC